MAELWSGKWAAVNTRKPATATLNEVAPGWKLVRRGGTEVVAAAGGRGDVTALAGQTHRRDFEVISAQKLANLFERLTF